FNYTVSSAPSPSVGLICGQDLTAPPVVASAPGVPTLSEWGLIVLALMLMTAGTLYLVQPMVSRKEV
ncbi:MAG: IPTL-CTERM sorting domain-containing protein, partial [Chitinophagales bacterium]